MLTSCYYDNDTGERVSLRGKLEHLEICGNKLTDDTVFHLRSLTNLKCLKIDDNQRMTINALEHVADMRQLQSLSINKVTDAGRWIPRSGGLVTSAF
jgi:hypothetical protein